MRPPTGSRLIFPLQDTTSPSCFNFCTALGTAGLHPESHKNKNVLKLAFVPRTARSSVEAELIPVSRLAEQQHELRVRRRGVDVQTRPCSFQRIFIFYFFLFASALEIPISLCLLVFFLSMGIRCLLALWGPQERPFPAPLLLGLDLKRGRAEMGESKAEPWDLSPAPGNRIISRVVVVSPSSDSTHQAPPLGWDFGGLKMLVEKGLHAVVEHKG